MPKTWWTIPAALCLRPNSHGHSLGTLSSSRKQVGNLQPSASLLTSNSKSPVSSPALEQMNCCGLCFGPVPLLRGLSRSRWSPLLSSLLWIPSMTSPSSPSGETDFLPRPLSGYMWQVLRCIPYQVTHSYHTPKSQRGQQKPRNWRPTGQRLDQISAPRSTTKLKPKCVDTNVKTVTARTVYRPYCQATLPQMVLRDAI